LRKVCVEVFQWGGREMRRKILTRKKLDPRIEKKD